MIETREKEINGNLYTVTQLPARRALRLKAKLLKVFGPTFAQFFLSVSDKSDEQAQKENIVKAIEMLATSIDPNELETLVFELLQGVKRNNVDLNTGLFDIDFAGDLGSLYQLCWFVIEVNFGNFLAQLGIGSQYPSQKTEPPVTKKTFVKK